jgi:2-phospho-L-lactate guanylyltransferase (CobY/MobA/RfbA family)
LFEAFLYGTGIVHSPSDRNRENRDRLSELVRQHGRENVIMALNASFWSVFKYAVDSFHVVKQDYERWTKLDGCVGSDMFDIYSLLQSHGSQ